MAAAHRLARACTGRDLILTCGYHGWVNSMGRAGVPAAMGGLYRDLPWGRADAFEAAFDELGGDRIAAVSVACGYADIEAGRDFLPALRALTRQHGSLLIFDEIVTGFRLRRAGAQEYFGVTPDLAVFAKGLSNGVPLSCYLGRRDLMENVADVVVSSTFGGDTLGLAAAGAVLDVYQEEDVIGVLWERGRQLHAGLERTAARLGVAAGFRGLPPAGTSTCRRRRRDWPSRASACGGGSSPTPCSTPVSPTPRRRGGGPGRRGRGPRRCQGPGAARDGAGARPGLPVTASSACARILVLGGINMGLITPRRSAAGPRTDPARRALLQLPRRQGGDPGGGGVPDGGSRQNGWARRRGPLRPRPPGVPALARRRHCGHRRRWGGRVRRRGHPGRRQRPEPGPGDLRRQPALRRRAVAGGGGRAPGDGCPALADGDPLRRVAAGGEGRERAGRPRHPRPGPGRGHSGGSLRGLRHHRPEPVGGRAPDGRRRRGRGVRRPGRRPAAGKGGARRGDQDGGTRRFLQIRPWGGVRPGLRRRSRGHDLRGRRLPRRPRRRPGRGPQPGRRRHLRGRGRGPGRDPPRRAGLDAGAGRGRGASHRAHVESP